MVGGWRFCGRHPLFLNPQNTKPRKETTNDLPL